MKEDITNHVAFCQSCHRAFLIGDEGEGYTCYACMAELMDEPQKVEWDEESSDSST